MSGLSLGESYLSAEMQSVYSAAPTNCAKSMFKKLRHFFLNKSTHKLTGYRKSLAYLSEIKVFSVFVEIS